MTSFEDADQLSRSLLTTLEAFWWFSGIGVMRDADNSFYVTIRVNPKIPLDVARIDSNVQELYGDVKTVFSHQEEIVAY